MDIYYVDCINGELIQDSNGEALCHSFSNLPFRIQKIVLTPTSHSSINIIEQAKKRLELIRFNPANSSGVIRDNTEIRFKSFCGLIIEQLCFSMLTYYNKNPNVKIELDDNNHSINQIDLKIQKRWTDHQLIERSITKTVEIRSSFPFKPIEKVVAQDFDILGGYRNDVKKGEIEKDFYLRFLFSLNYTPESYVRENQKIDYSKTSTNVLKNVYFDENLNLKTDLTIYFIGGATNSMMLDESIAYNGNMRSSNFNQSNIAQYKKIKARNALDCIAIMQMMLNVITTEAINGK
ncbi:hypothetical protein DC083_08645 [Ignatzschineria ureiclastica]|uniref:Uncharacterized protein n=1 Tax=Ignatzschineria ureiclastica TaxID=472582 RepID=A0A2U2ACJ2_9GAMM|nr:hypothetical protein [Ignatzschineria ureiclastica]PWD80376.1 hypothetical protein DC083_08645 [Ignatzschineria ureiclastica]GGZ99958.1 hypothetical protein GCM10007162_15240 [Ignatzschineria ureiclastica]